MTRWNKTPESQTNVNVGHVINIAQGDGGVVNYSESESVKFSQKQDEPRANTSVESVTPSMSISRLSDLMISLFVEGWELRAFIRHSPRLQVIEPFLPDGSASRAELAFRTTQLLESRGLVDEFLFDRLKAERSRRTGDIESVQQALLGRSPRVYEKPSEVDFPPCDVLLVTATTVEIRTLLDQARELSGQQDRPRFLRNTYSYLGQVGQASTYAVRSEMGIGTPGGSLLTVRNAISEIKPKAVIMVGIAFGVDPQHQSLGDVLVATQLHYYSPDRIGTAPDGTPLVVPRGSRADATGWVISRFRESANHWDGEVHFGLVLSGESLIDNLVFRNQLLRRSPEALGGEMEGAGLYAAAWDTQVPWIVVKSICDWADGDKAVNKSARQADAAKHACGFVLTSLARGGFREAPLAP